jgi:hypothetical protein
MVFSESIAAISRMGKHGSYPRVERDLFPTPAWVVNALAEHVDLRGLTVWEPACGDGRMGEALRSAGCAVVHMSDIADYGNGQDEVLDFLSAQAPKLGWLPDLICTNPAYGRGGKIATAFVEAGLKRLSPGGMLTLLLSCDFDSAKTRARYFGDCPHYVAKIVLTKRIVWFERADGVREAPKENHAWFLWQRSLLRVRPAPVILYSPLPYDANADFVGSINDCYAAVRARVAGGGSPWIPPSEAC